MKRWAERRSSSCTRRGRGFRFVITFVALSATARATVAPDLAEWLNPGPVPANGAILLDPGEFSGPALPEVHMSGSGGDIAGTVAFIEDSQFLTFRPTSPPAPGTYHVSVTGPDGELLAFDVDIVESMVEAPFEVTISPSLGRAWRFGGARACCGGTPTTGDGCFDVESVEYDQFTANVSSPLVAPEAGQYVYRVADAPPGEPDSSGAIWSGYDRGWKLPSELPGLFGPYPVSAAPYLYCVTIEALSLVSGTTLPATQCVPGNGTPLGSRPRTDYSGLRIETCPLPPPGFQEQWCSGLWGECDYGLAFQSPSSQDTQVRICADYYRLCPKPPPPAATPARSVPPPPPEPHHRDLFACNVTRPGSSSLTPYGSALVAVLLGVVARRRRRTRKSSRCAAD